MPRNDVWTDNATNDSDRDALRPNQESHSLLESGTRIDGNRSEVLSSPTKGKYLANNVVVEVNDRPS